MLYKPFASVLKCIQDLFQSDMVKTCRRETDSLEEMYACRFLQLGGVADHARGKGSKGRVWVTAFVVVFIERNREVR